MEMFFAWTLPFPVSHAKQSCRKMSRAASARAAQAQLSAATTSSAGTRYLSLGYRPRTWAPSSTARATGWPSGPITRSNRSTSRPGRPVQSWTVRGSVVDGARADHREVGDGCAPDEVGLVLHHMRELRQVDLEDVAFLGLPDRNGDHPRRGLVLHPRQGHRVDDPAGVQ